MSCCGGKLADSSTAGRGLLCLKGPRGGAVPKAASHIASTVTEQRGEGKRGEERGSKRGGERRNGMKRIDR